MEWSIGMQPFFKLSLVIAAFIAALQLLPVIPKAATNNSINSETTNASFSILPGNSNLSANISSRNNIVNRNPTNNLNNLNQQKNRTISQQSLTQQVSIGGLKLQSTPKLDFGKVGIDAIYQGSSVSLSNNVSKTFAPVTVSDYRGYSSNYRGWSVMAQLSGFSNGIDAITPTMTLKLYQNIPKRKIIRSVVINSQTATTVLSSQTLPTNGVKVISAFTSEASALNFNTLSQKQRNNFMPGTYRGSIVWTLSNTAASN